MNEIEIAQEVVAHTVLHPHCMVVITSADADDLFTRLWPAVRSEFEHSVHRARFTSTQVSVYQNDNEYTWRVMPLLADPKCPERFAGYCGNGLLVVVDETKKPVDSRIQEVLKGAMYSPDSRMIQA